MGPTPPLSTDVGVDCTSSCQRPLRQLCTRRLLIVDLTDGSTIPKLRWRWLFPDATPDAHVLLTARGMRALGDGSISVLLPVYLLGLGLDGFQIGAIATATLVGSAVLTLGDGFIA